MLKLFRLLEPYRGYVAIVLVLALAQSIGVLLLPRLMSDIVDRGIVRGDQRAIVEIGGLMLLISVAATGCTIAGSFFSSRVATGFGRILRGAIPLSQAMQLKIDRLNLVLGEGLSGVRVIRAFDRGAHQRERFDQANLDLTNTAISVNRLIAVLMPALIAMLGITNIA